MEAIIPGRRERRSGAFSFCKDDQLAVDCRIL